MPDNYVVPHMLVDGDREAMEMTFINGGYGDALPEEDHYVEGDLVEVGADGIVRRSRAAAVDVPALFLAGAQYPQPFGIDHNGYRSRTLEDVPLNVIPDKNLFVFTYQGGGADTDDVAFTEADLRAVQGREQRDIAWNADEGCYTIRDTATNARVTLLDVFQGEVGDNNVQVVARLDPVGA